MRFRHYKRYVSSNDRCQARTNLDDFKLEALRSAFASNDAIKDFHDLWVMWKSSLF